MHSYLPCCLKSVIILLSDSCDTVRSLHARATACRGVLCAGSAAACIWQVPACLATEAPGQLRLRRHAVVAMAPAGAPLPALIARHRQLSWCVGPAAGAPVTAGYCAAAAVVVARAGCPGLQACIGSILGLLCCKLCVCAAALYHRCLDGVCDVVFDWLC